MDNPEKMATSQTIYEKLCSVRLYRELFVERIISYKRYLCLVGDSGVQHILCCVFVLIVFVLCTLCCHFLWFVHFWFPLRYSLTFIYLVYPMLPFSLAYPFLITPSVFSNVYLSCVIYVAIFSGLSISDCPFCVLPEKMAT
jgi:hypothetical protein